MLHVTIESIDTTLARAARLAAAEANSSSMPTQTRVFGFSWAQQGDVRIPTSVVVLNVVFFFFQTVHGSDLILQENLVLSPKSILTLPSVPSAYASTLCWGWTGSDDSPSFVLIADGQGLNYGLLESCPEP